MNPGIHWGPFRRLSGVDLCLNRQTSKQSKAAGRTQAVVIHTHGLSECRPNRAATGSQRGQTIQYRYGGYREYHQQRGRYSTSPE